VVAQSEIVRFEILTGFFKSGLLDADFRWIQLLGYHVSPVRDASHKSELDQDEDYRKPHERESR